MQTVKYSNLALAFLLELCMLAMLGYWGFKTGQQPVAQIGLGIGIPLIVAVVWGVFMAPASPKRLHDPWLTIAEMLIFAIAAVALYYAGQRDMAIAFAVLVVLNRILLFVLGTTP